MAHETRKLRGRGHIDMRTAWPSHKPPSKTYRKENTKRDKSMDFMSPINLKNQRGFTDRWTDRRIHRQQDDLKILF
jgi:hypothetical protein